MLFRSSAGVDSRVVEGEAVDWRSPILFILSLATRSSPTPPPGDAPRLLQSAKCPLPLAGERRCASAAIGCQQPLPPPPHLHSRRTPPTPPDRRIARISAACRMQPLRSDPRGLLDPIAVGSPAPTPGRPISMTKASAHCLHAPHSGPLALTPSQRASSSPAARCRPHLGRPRPPAASCRCWL